MWWFAVILMGIGEMGNFAAYGFAPATLIAPLGCVSVIGRCDLFNPPLPPSCIIYIRWVKVAGISGRLVSFWVCLI